MKSVGVEARHWLTALGKKVGDMRADLRAKLVQ